MTTFRNPYLAPFAVNSIWNTPIGSGAVFVAAGLSATPGGGAGYPSWDREPLILSPTSPLTQVVLSNGGWGGNRCTTSGGVQQTVPIPTNYVIASDGYNECSAALQPDYRTVSQAVAFARCTAGGSATCFQAFPDVDFYGTGEMGGHGGSGLSSLGGSVRLGELRPGNTIGPTHALKLNLDEHVLYSGSPGYRWPADRKDAYAYAGSNAALKIGALLALPPSVNLSTNSLGLSTAPAKLLAWTLQNYGCYIVDSFNSNTNVVQFCSEWNGSSSNWEAQFTSDWGYGPTQWGGTSSGNGLLWQQDIGKIIAALQIVDNNASNNVGGGGTPRVALAAPLAGDFKAEAHAFNNTATGWSINVPAYTTNDVLFSCFATTGDVVVTLPAGWTLIGATSAGPASTNTQQVTAWRVANAEPTNYVWSTTALTTGNGYIWVLKDVSATSPIHAVSQNSGSGTTITATAVTTTVNNSLLVYSAANHSAATTWSPNNFWTQRNGVGPSSTMQAIGNTAQLYDKINTGNFVTTTTGGAAGDSWTAQLIAFAPNTAADPVSASPSITGVAATGGVGAANDTMRTGALAGASAAVSIGVIQGRIVQGSATAAGVVGALGLAETSNYTISGAAGSGATGSVINKLAANISGATATASVGALVVSVGASSSTGVAGVQAATSVGNVSEITQKSLPLTGVSGSALAGSVLANPAKTIVGAAAATVSVGSVLGNVAGVVSGVSGTGSVAAVPSAHNIFGATAAGAVGSILATGSSAVDFGGQGVVALGAPGSVLTAISQAVAVAGAVATGSGGTLVALSGVEQAMQGVAATGLAGGFQKQLSGFIAGVASGSGVGNVGIDVDASTALSGATAAASAGSVAASNVSYLFGTQCASAVGQLATFKETDLVGVGVSASGAASALTDQVVTPALSVVGATSVGTFDLPTTTNPSVGGVAGNTFVTTIPAQIYPFPMTGVVAQGLPGGGFLSPYIDVSAPAFVRLDDFALYIMTLKDAA